MHDVTWRTGCTFTILVLLILLGSGRLIEDPGQAPTPLPGSEGMDSASLAASPTPPEAGTALPPAGGGTSVPGATTKAYRLVSHRLPVPR